MNIFSLKGGVEVRFNDNCFCKIIKIIKFGLYGLGILFTNVNILNTDN